MTLELPEDLEKRLEKVAKNLNVTKQYCIEQAILAYVEDQEDYQSAIERLDEIKESIPLKKLKKELKIE